MPFDATTNFEVGNVHNPARTWIVDPNKGVGAAGLEGGDFVGVGRPPTGLGQAPTYEELLTQTIAQSETLQAMWQYVENAVANDPQHDPCSGIGGPSSLVPWLQQVSTQACSVARNASLAALGYTLNCSGAGSGSAGNAQNAANVACTLSYTWRGPEWGPYGTTTMTGSYSGTCLDIAFFGAVEQQCRQRSTPSVRPS